MSHMVDDVCLSMILNWSLEGKRATNGNQVWTQRFYYNQNNFGTHFTLNVYCETFPVCS